MNKKMGSLILIAFGIVFLLYNLKIINFTPWSLIWPGIIIWLGADQLNDSLRDTRQGRNAGWETIFWLSVTLLGFYMLLPKIGIAAPPIPWNVVWPTLLILVGLTMLFSRGNKIISIHGKSEHNAPWSKEYRRSLVGEFNRGPTSWVVDDMKIHQSIGSINLDLTNAIMPDREVVIEISGFIGDTNVYLPPGLQYHVESSLKVGEITVLDHNESGTHRCINVKSTDYENATKKVHIIINWKIGDVNVRQIR